MYGLLHCVDSKRKPLAKARGFYELLRYGKFEENRQIRKNETDMSMMQQRRYHMFKKICALVTSDIIVNAELPKIYYTDEELCILESAADQVLDDFLEAVFEDKKILSNE